MPQQQPNPLKTRSVSSEFLRNLELISSKIFPLHGATFKKGNHSDPRINSATTILGTTDTLTLYEHIATVRNKASDKFYIAFRQTLDCLYLEQRDLSKYPKWLMNSDAKLTELSIHIYQVKERNGQPIFPKNIPNPVSHEDWLEPIKDDATFDAVQYFLLNHKDISIGMFKSE